MYRNAAACSPCPPPAGAASWVAMAMFVHSPAAAVAMMALGAIGTACSDVVVDSIVVERSRGEPQVGFASRSRCTSIS